MAAEHDRLLSPNHDPEAGNEREGVSCRSRVDVYRERTAKFLESKALHQSVIALARNLKSPTIATGPD